MHNFFPFLFKEKTNVLEKIYEYKFDKNKVCKESAISKTCLYKILREKDTIISMNVLVFDINKLKISENLYIERIF